MRSLIPLLLIGSIGCVDSDRVPVEIQIARGSCQVSQIDLYLLRIQQDESPCVIARGTSEGPGLPPMQITDEEVVLLALASGEIVPDAGIQEDTYYSPDAFSPDAFSPDAGQQPFCGDNNCDAATGEDCQSCPQDCGQCYSPDSGFQPYCGDNNCDHQIGEDCQSCPMDCGQC